MPKVSIVIPVYGVEAYLPMCLQSVSRQTFRDFELILVDDGSPDSCGEMCDRYASEHPNTIVIHQENMGLSEARNQGVKASSGEYVAFIDSDDSVTDDYIEYLLYLIEKYGTDVSVAGTHKFWNDKVGEISDSDVTDSLVPASEALSRICYGKMSITAWGKLYKRHLVEKYPYPKGQLYEDTATTYKIVGDTSAVAYGTKKIYCWRQRAGSITHDGINEKHLIGIVGAKEQIEYMEKNYPTAVPAAKARCAMKIIDLAFRLVMGKEKNMELFGRIRNEAVLVYKDVLRDPKAGLSLKVRIFALRLGYIPYLLLSKLYYIVK